MISPHRYPSRRDKLKRLIKKGKLPAVLVSDETNVRYLTGFTGDSTWLLIGPEIEILISDGRFTTQIAEECPEIDVYVRPVSQGMVGAARKVLSKQKISAVGFESTALNFSTATQLGDSLKNQELVPVSGLVESLREVKDADEIAEIRTAIHAAEKGYEYLRASLRPEMTELEASFVLEQGMRKFGALGASFETIVAVGANAALPHARPGETNCSESPFLLVDWGARTKTGYVSDLTRMIITGSISSKLQRMYEVVKTAQEQAIKAIGPGVESRAVDRIARHVIEQAGVGPKFNHGLGHGLGLQVHESIRINPQANTVFKPGMVVTVEPGVYFPGWGGIRIEDDLLVTKQGCEVLSSVPKDLASSLLAF